MHTQIGGADPLIKDYFGSSVIFSHVMPAPVIRHFITRYGLSPNESNENQQTPLHMVISSDTSFYWIDGGSVVTQGGSRKRVTTTAVVAALLQLKANVNALDNKRQTPLDYAVREEVRDDVYVHALFIILIIVDTSGHLRRTPAHAPRRQSHHTQRRQVDRLRSCPQGLPQGGQPCSNDGRPWFHPALHAPPSAQDHVQQPRRVC